MLKFILKDDTENSVLYEYFPEGGTESGIVSYSRRSGACSVEILAKNDVHKRYALKMLKRLREMASCGSFAEKGMIAWY